MTGMTLPVDEWSHVDFTVDRGDINIFINGEMLHSGSDFPNIFTNTNAVFGLGVNYWDEPYQGMIDDLRVYDNMVLSQDDIQVLVDYETN